MKRFFANIEGQGLAEYALVLSLVAVVVTAVLALLGPQIGNVFSRIMGVATPVVTNPQPNPTPDCYGSLLLSVMVGLMFMTILVSSWLPKKPVIATAL